MGWTQDDIPDLTGKVAYVSGGSQGIGYQIVHGLASRGCKVIFSSHSDQVAHDALDALRKELPNATIQWKQVDFADLHDTLRMVQEIQSELDELHLVINNAGIGVERKGLTKDGIDKHFQINVLASYLVNKTLLPLLQQTAAKCPPGTVRIVNMASSLHQAAPGDEDFTDLEEFTTDDARVMDGTRLYSRTKLAIILYSKKLATVAKPIVVFATHPGAVKTSQNKSVKDSYGMIGYIGMTIMQTFFRDVSTGCLSALWAATSPDAVDKSGSYVQDPDYVGGETKQADDPRLADNVWNLMDELLKEKL